jgi:hypothetical protein
LVARRNPFRPRVFPPKAYILPSTAATDKALLGVGSGAFCVQVFSDTLSETLLSPDDNTGLTKKVLDAKKTSASGKIVRLLNISNQAKLSKVIFNSIQRTKCSKTGTDQCSIARYAGLCLG